MHPSVDGDLSHVHMHEGRKHADDQVGTCDACVALGVVASRQGKRLTARVTAHLGLGCFKAQIANLNLPLFLLRLPQQMRDE